MANKMWMGIPGVHMQWVPCPLIDSTVTRTRFVESVKYQSGGGDVSRSKQYQMQYNFNFNAPAHELDGIDAFNRFASGFYGDGLIHIAHPAAFETNLFPAAWASPGIIETGWKNIYSTTPTFDNTVSNIYNQPKRSATWSVAGDAGTMYKKATIVIPPTYTLSIGASGAATGAAVVRVQPYNADGTEAATTDLTLLSASSPTRMNTSFDGSTYQAVDVYITRTSSAASSITITSMMAQLYKTGTTPSLPANHYQGEGSTGLEFMDDAIVETYSYMYPPRKGISTTLCEVEAWR